MSRIVMTGKRTRKPKDFEENKSKPEYGNGTKCVVNTREYEFYNFETKKSKKSKYEVCIYETNSTWGITNNDWYKAINTLAEAQKFVEDNFGGKWVWNKIPRKLVNIRETDPCNEVLDKSLEIYKELCKKFEDSNKEDEDLFKILRNNSMSTINALRNSFQEKDNVRMESEKYFVIRCIEDFARFFDREYDYE